MPSFLTRPAVLGMRAAAAGLCLVVAACGGRSDAPPAGESGPAAVAPSITQQPADLSVASGRPASFTVTAGGTAPLTYQWQRNGADIAGATAATVAIAATVPADSGSVFRAIVRNSAGMATSNDATLTVTVAPPVLTITQQPANAAVTAGAAASFSVAATCSSGALNIQWQRHSGSAGAFVAIASATAPVLTVAAAGVADNGAQFRALLDCGGQSATPTAVATLTVASPAGAVVTPVPVTGLQRQAAIRLSRGIVRESTGSYAFVSGNAVLRLAADLQSITAIAGAVDDVGGTTVDGVGAAARFNGAYGITVDAAGNLYVSEQAGNVIRRIASDGTVTTIAGSPGVTGSADGTGSAARFYLPGQIAIGPDGDVYVADRGNRVVRRVTPAGAVSTYAGVTGVFGYADGPAAAARFGLPTGIAVAGDGTVYVGDTDNHRIRRIRRSGNAAGSVETLAGDGTGTATRDGSGGTAAIPLPADMGLAGATLYVRDGFGLIRKIDTGSAAVTTLAGTSGATAPRDGPRGAATIGGFSLGSGGLACTTDGGLIITETLLFLGAVRSVDASGRVTTIAVANPFGSNGFTAGTAVLSRLPFAWVPQDTRPGGLSQFSGTASVAGAPDGSLVVSTTDRVRRIAPDGSVTPIIGLVGAGNFDGTGSAADVVGATRALLVDPSGVVYFSDASNIRAIDATGTTRVIAGAAGSPTTPLGGEGAVDGPAATARFAGVPAALARAANGDLYVSDSQNFAIRRIDAAGQVSTYAGALKQRGTADGAASVARFTLPLDLSWAPDGSLWLLDGGRNTTPSVRRIAPDGSVSTLPTLARRLTVDPAGTIYVLSDAGDLASMDPASGALTVLVRQGTRLVLGNDPRLGFGSLTFTATGIRQLVMISDDQLIKVTLP